MYGKETTQFGKKIHRTEDALILHRALQYKQKSRISHMAKKKKKKAHHRCIHYFSECKIQASNAPTLQIHIFTYL